MSMRNSAATVGAAVRSVQIQTLEDWEFIVIDDGSTDNGASIVNACDDARVHLVKEASGAGLAARLNQAVGLSRGEFIARMDADDICFPDRLARQVARLRADPELDLLGCGAVVFSRDAGLVGQLPIKLTHREIVAHPFRGFSLPHPTWCGRAEWFRNNPYDPRLMKTQDQDLLLRTFANSRFASLEDVLVGYRQDALDLKKMLVSRQIFARSLWQYAVRSGRPVTGLAGIGGQVFKAGVDVAAVGLGFNRLAQQARLKPVAPAIMQQWQDLQTKLALVSGAD
jgi:glycosyltransferase involved in cell wall biosynthesis